MTLKGSDDILPTRRPLSRSRVPAKSRLTPFALLLIALSVACSPSPSPVKVIVGAQLDPGHNNPRLEHSVIVIRDGKFQAVGSQASTPVPKGAELISGAGKLITPIPSSALIAAGEPADLVLRDAATHSAEMIMHEGEWLK